MTTYHGKKILDLGSFPKWLRAAYSACPEAIPRGLQSEVVSIEDAHLRVTAEDVIAVDDVPRWPLAAYEGYGVRASDVNPTPAVRPAILDFLPDSPNKHQRVDKPLTDPLPAKHIIDTLAHGVLPEGVDAVVPREADKAPDSAWFKQIWLWRSPRPGTGVIARASDVAAGQRLIAKGQRLTAERQAALIAAGVRKIKVSKRPRIGVVVSSYDRCPPLVTRSGWQTMDACGPYIRLLLQRWGFDVPPVEYLSPPPMAGLTLETRRAGEGQYRQRVKELVQRYDLIIGSGISELSSYRDLGLNCLRWFGNYGIDYVNKVDQRPGDYFNFATSPDRSPPFNENIKEVDEHGRVRRYLQIHHRDQTTLMNLPGSQGAVAVLMHVLVRRVIDMYEFVDTPGPYWEIGELAHDVECDRATNLMRWAKVVWGVRGEPLIELLPAQEPNCITAFLDAEVIAAIPAGNGRLGVGSRVHFLRLDPTRQPAAPNCAKPEPIEIISDPIHPTELDPMHPQMTVAESWQRLDGWLQSMPAAAPEGFKAPACDAEIHLLEGALGAKLPDDFVASVKIHNGQADRCMGCFNGDNLLDVRGILREWTSWRDLVVEGAFDGITSDPDGGIKDDWFNLQWIPFAANGMGDCLCLDLDPAPGGTVGQVIRVLHDDERRECLAASYEQWLDGMVKELTGLAHQDE